MGELKTKPHERKSAEKFVRSVEHAKRREDALVILELMQKVTGEKPVMWGESIVGFGSYPYKRSTGEQHEWFAVGFSPRKAALVIYPTPCFADFKNLVTKLGKVKTSVSCIYITDLAKVDITILTRIIRESIKAVKKKT